MQLNLSPEAYEKMIQQAVKELEEKCQKKN